MAYATVYLSNGVEVKKAPVGFAWTVLLFGFFVPLFRADWLWFVALLSMQVLSWVFFPIAIVCIVMAFFYNKIYMKSLFEKGYKIHNSDQVSDQKLKEYLGYLNLPGKE